MKQTQFSRLPIGARFFRNEKPNTEEVAYYYKADRKTYLVVYHDYQNFPPMVCDTYASDFAVWQPLP